MTPGLERYRAVASEVVNHNIDTPAEMREATREQLDRLKFHMYIERLSDSQFDKSFFGESVANWIKAHPQKTQVFLNELGADLDKPEDGIIGPKTKSAITTYFGINIDTISETAGVEFDVPEEFLNNSTIMSALREHGIVRGEKVTILNSDAVEKFNRYKSIFNFISDVDRDASDSEIQDKAGLMDNYVFLINEGSDWIDRGLKEVLQYKFAEAIYNDVIRMGCIIERNGVHGEYTIRSIRTGESDENNPYLRVIRDANTRDLIDVARVSSMVGKDFELNSRELVGEKSLLDYLLKKHRIKDKTGNNFLTPENMLLDKDFAHTQIAAAIEAVRGGSDTSAQAFQELRFLQEYINEAEIDRQEYSRNVLTKVNRFRGFIDDSALIAGFDIDAIRGGGDLSALEQVANGIENNRGAILAIALIAWFLKRKSEKGSKLALPLVIAALVGPSIARAADGTIVGATDLAGFTDDDLEIIRPHEINPRLNNPDYQKVFNAMVTINNSNLESRVAAGQELPHVNNSFILARITNAISKDNIDIPNITDSETIPEIAEDIFTKITQKNVSNDEFPNYRGESAEITQADVEAYLRILTSNNLSARSASANSADASDRSLRDFLSEGLSIESSPYGSDIEFIGEPGYDSALNERLRNKWNTGDEATRELITDIQDILKRIEGSSDDMRISEVDKAIVDLDRIPAHDFYKETLEDYKEYLRVEREIEALEERERNEVGLIITEDNYNTVATPEQQEAFIDFIEGSITEDTNTVRETLGSSPQHRELYASIGEVLFRRMQVKSFVQEAITERNREEINRQREEAGLPPLGETPSSVEGIETQEQFTNMLEAEAEKLDEGIQDLLNTVEGIDIDDLNDVNSFLSDRNRASSYGLLAKITTFAQDAAHNSLDGDTISNADGSINFQKKVIVTLRNRGEEEVERVKSEIKSVAETYFSGNNDIKTSINEISFDYSRIGDPAYITELIGKINGINISRLEAAPDEVALTEIGITGIVHSTVTPEVLTQLFEEKLESIITAISTEIAGEDDINNLNIAKDTIIPVLRVQGLDTTAIEGVITGRIQEINAAAIAAAAEEARRSAAERNRVLALKTTDAEITRKGIETHMRALQSDLEVLASGADVALAALADESLLTVTEINNVKVSEILEIIQKSEYSSLSSITPFIEWYRECGLID